MRKRGRYRSKRSQYEIYPAIKQIVLKSRMKEKENKKDKTSMTKIYCNFLQIYNIVEVLPCKVLTLVCVVVSPCIFASQHWYYIILCPLHVGRFCPTAAMSQLIKIQCKNTYLFKIHCRIFVSTYYLSKLI